MSDHLVEQVQCLTSCCFTSTKARRIAHQLKLPWEHCTTLSAHLEHPFHVMAAALGDEASERYDNDSMNEYFAYEKCGSPMEELFLAYLAQGYAW